MFCLCSNANEIIQEERERERDASGKEMVAHFRQPVRMLS